MPLTVSQAPASHFLLRGGKTMKIVEQGLLTRQEAAVWLSVSDDTVRRLEKRGELEFVKVGRQHRYTLDALRACIAKRQEGGAA
jgi:excisionase family DNA binding protein